MRPLSGCAIIFISYSLRTKSSRSFQFLFFLIFATIPIMRLKSTIFLSIPVAVAICCAGSSPVSSPTQDIKPSTRASQSHQKSPSLTFINTQNKVKESKLTERTNVRKTFNRDKKTIEESVKDFTKGIGKIRGKVPWLRFFQPQTTITKKNRDLPKSVKEIEN